MDVTLSIGGAGGVGPLGSVGVASATSIDGNVLMAREEDAPLVDRVCSARGLSQEEIGDIRSSGLRSSTGDVYGGASSKSPSYVGGSTCGMGSSAKSPLCRLVSMDGLIGGAVLVVDALLRPPSGVCPPPPLRVTISKSVPARPKGGASATSTYSEASSSETSIPDPVCETCDRLRRRCG